VLQIRTDLRVYPQMCKAWTALKHFWETELDPYQDPNTDTYKDPAFWVDTKMFERVRLSREERADGKIHFQFPRDFNMCFDLVERLEGIHAEYCDEYAQTKHHDTYKFHVIRDLPRWVDKIKSACGNEWWEIQYHRALDKAHDVDDLEERNEKNY